MIQKWNWTSLFNIKLWHFYNGVLVVTQDDFLFVFLVYCHESILRFKQQSLLTFVPVGMGCMSFSSKGCEMKQQRWMKSVDLVSTWTSVIAQMFLRMWSPDAQKERLDRLKNIGRQKKNKKSQERTSQLKFQRIRSPMRFSSCAFTMS